jgi:hypothetical protein
MPANLLIADYPPSLSPASYLMSLSAALSKIAVTAPMMTGDLKMACDHPGMKLKNSGFTIGIMHMATSLADVLRFLITFVGHRQLSAPSLIHAVALTSG